MTRTKKVIMIIVEGSCDQTLLAERLDEIVEESEMRVEPYNGDIMHDPENKHQLIKNAVGSFVSERIKERKFEVDDVLAVLHVIDTDGCLIPESNVKVEEGQGINTFYNNDSIDVINSAQQKRIIKRNIKRTKNIVTMSSTNRVLKKIPYQIYYMSRNMEHVLFDTPNPTKKLKPYMVDKFIDELRIPVEDFLFEHLVPLESEIYEEKYKESWEYLKGNLNSLKKGTNLTLMFEYIDILINNLGNDAN